VLAQVSWYAQGWAHAEFVNNRYPPTSGYHSSVSDAQEAREIPRHTELFLTLLVGGGKRRAGCNRGIERQAVGPTHNKFRGALAAMEISARENASGRMRSSFWQV